MGNTLTVFHVADVAIVFPQPQKGPPMLDTIRNAVYASLGLVAITQDKLKGFVEEWVKRGELTRDQGKKLIDELIQRSQSEGKALSDRIAAEVVRVLDMSPFATRREIRILEDRILELETRGGMSSPAGSERPRDSSTGPAAGAGACGLDEDVGV